MSRSPRAYEPTGFGRYYFTTRSEVPTLHLDTECQAISHIQPEWLATATIPHWMVHWMKACRFCVDNEHRLMVQDAWFEQHEEYLARQEAEA